MKVLVSSLLFVSFSVLSTVLPIKAENPVCQKTVEDMQEFSVRREISAHLTSKLIIISTLMHVRKTLLEEGGSRAINQIDKTVLDVLSTIEKSDVSELEFPILKNIHKVFTEFPSSNIDLKEGIDSVFFKLEII